MVLGNAGKKLGTMVELAEELYEKVTELKEQLAATRETVEETRGRVEELEREAARQRALIEAIAEEQGIDVGAVVDGAEPPSGDGGSVDPAAGDGGEAAAED